MKINPLKEKILKNHKAFSVLIESITDEINKFTEKI